MSDPGLCWDPGDFILLFYGHAHNSIPTLPGGVTAAVGGGAQAGGPLGHRSSYRFLQSGDTSIGAWGAQTGEENGEFLILRGVHPTTPIGRASGSGGSGGTVTFPALTAPLLGGSTSWVVGGVQVTGSAATLATPPTGMTNHVTDTGEVLRKALHSTNGPVSSWSNQSVNTGLGGNWQTTVMEIRAAPGQSISLRDAGFWPTETLNLPAACVVAERFVAYWL